MTTKVGENLLEGDEFLGHGYDNPGFAESLTEVRGHVLVDNLDPAWPAAGKFPIEAKFQERLKEQGGIVRASFRVHLLVDKAGPEADPERSPGAIGLSLRSLLDLGGHSDDATLPDLGRIPGESRKTGEHVGGDRAHGESLHA